MGNIQLELIKSGEEAFTWARGNFVNDIWKAENSHLDTLPNGSYSQNHRIIKIGKDL